MDLASKRARIKCLCCREWGMTPRAFEDAVLAEEIALEDVAELVIYLAMMEGERFLDWMFREEREAAKLVAEAQEATKRQIEIMQRQMSVQPDPRVRERFKAEIDRLTATIR